MGREGRDEVGGGGAEEEAARSLWAGEEAILVAGAGAAGLLATMV